MVELIVMFFAGCLCGLCATAFMIGAARKEDINYKKEENGTQE